MIWDTKALKKPHFKHVIKSKDATAQSAALVLLFWAQSNISKN